MDITMILPYLDIFGWKTLHSQATLGFDSSPYEWGEWLKHTKSSCSKAFKTYMCHCQVTCFTHVSLVFLMAINGICLMPCSWWSSWDLWSYRIDEHGRRACGSAFKLKINSDIIIMLHYTRIWIWRFWFLLELEQRCGFSPWWIGEMFWFNHDPSQ